MFCFINCFKTVSVLFQPTIIRLGDKGIVGDEKMKTTRIALALIAVIGLSAIIAGLAFAQYTRTFATATGNIQETFDEDWWTEMREHMQARWYGIEDEEWFNDMNQYMQEHWNEVQNQEWFNQMLEYMQEHGYHSYGYNNYQDYHGPRSYGRGFGCWGW
jgi:hypothetical protein